MIRIQSLEKSYQKLQVLKGINLSVEPGKVTAIVGPNSAGKTTLIKSVLGLVFPDRGEILIDNERVNGRSDYRRKIGYMPQLARFPENLTLKELIALVQDLRHRPGETDMELFEAFDLGKEWDKPIRTLSGGTRQKVSAVIAFLFKPQILILDEPTAGLDPIASSNLKDKILKERDNGKTFILTSHIMSELEELSEHIVFLLEGKIYFEGLTEELVRFTGERNLERAIATLMKGRPAWTELQKS
ncbi:ABC transporter ATP-binding protein [bacterium]|nr:ABC transporter ATP-binding protein [bacterium]